MSFFGKPHAPFVIHNLRYHGSDNGGIPIDRSLNGPHDQRLAEGLDEAEPHAAHHCSLSVQPCLSASAHDILDPAKPIVKTIFLPPRGESDSLPQSSTVTHWKMVKTVCSVAAC
ncbi:hypothetical protein M3J09_004747 [Ascochyta lentis]